MLIGVLLRRNKKKEAAAAVQLFTVAEGETDRWQGDEKLNENIHERNGLAGDKMAIDADRTQDWIFDQIIYTRNKSKHGEGTAGGATFGSSVNNVLSDFLETKRSTS